MPGERYAEVVKRGIQSLLDRPLNGDRVAKIRLDMGNMMSETGVIFVDGGIIGSPAWKPGTTCMYLSGTHASEVAGCFRAGPLDTKVIGTIIGKASAMPGAGS